MIKNPGFEEGSSGWSSWSPHDGYHAYFLNNYGRTGVGSVAQFGSEGVVWRDVEGLMPGRTYEVSAWMQCSAEMHGKLSVHNTVEGSYAEVQSPHCNGAWSQLKLAFTADDTARVRTHLVRVDGGSGVLVWDDLQVTLID
jgi:hypothetical protein